MPYRHIPDHVRSLVVVLLENDVSINQIVLHTSVSRDTVKRVRRYLRDFDRTTLPLLALRGRPRILVPAQEKFVVDYLIDRPTSYISELVWVLRDEFDITVNEAVISETLRRLGWTRKLCKRVAAERSFVARTAWRGRMALWRPDQLVFLDESAANERTGYRKYGWSPQGTEPIQVASVRRSERWSILPAYTLEGWLDCTLLTHGAVTKDMFTDWVINRVLPHCNPYPEGPRCIIVLDNCAIHGDPILKEACRDAGVQLEYLPPYSPDFNPIELSFHILKAWIRLNIELASGFRAFGPFSSTQFSSQVQEDLQKNTLEVVDISGTKMILIT